MGLKISKAVIDFGLGDDPCPVNQTVEDTIVIANNTKKKIKFKFEPSAKKEWKLTFEPSSGTIDSVSRVRINISDMNRP